jgi:hypothetical protein
LSSEYTSSFVELLDRLVLESARPSVHKLVYHYTDLEAAKGIISSRTFWSTAHDCTNDKAELQSAHDVVREVARECLPGARGRSAIALAMLLKKYDSMFITMRRTIYLTCFSSLRDDADLWRKYTNSGGVCLALPIINEAVPNNSQKVSFTIDVNYSRKDLRKILRTSYRKVCAALDRADRSDANLGEGLNALYRIAAYASIYTKGSEWESEHEVRHVTFGRHDDSIIPNHRTRADGSDVRYTPVLVRHEGKRIALAEIIVGPQLDFENARTELLAHLDECGYTTDCMEYPNIKKSSASIAQ